MSNKNVNELNKKLEAEKICTIIVLIVVAINTVVEFSTFITAKTLDSLNHSLYALFATIVLGILLWIFKDVKKKGTPFAQSVITKLKVIAVVVLLAAFIPDIVASCADMIMNDTGISFNVAFGSETTFIAWIGVIIGIVSEIFKYGMKLQEDVDSIA